MDTQTPTTRQTDDAVIARRRAGRILYMLAEQADARYTATITARTGRSRWTLTADDERIPEIQDAYRQKINADQAWLTFLRTTRI